MNNMKIGLQLYSIRDKMENDLDYALGKVKEIGYDYVEFAGYFDRSAEQITAILEKYDLKCISVHQGLDFYQQKGQQAIEYVKALGAEYSVIPWYDAKTLKNNFSQTMDFFAEYGKMLYDGGLKMLYHNHDFEFDKLDGEFIIDKMYSTVDQKYLNPEFDTCWIKYAGSEPVEYLKKYRDRINIVHIKDFWANKLANGPVYALIDNEGNPISNTSSQQRDFEFRPVGSGIQDVKAIMDTCKDIGVDYVIVEQDEWYDRDSLQDAKKSRDFLKSIGY